MMEHPRNEPIFLWFDLETTGLEVVDGSDEILEVGYGFTGLDMHWLRKPISELTKPILPNTEQGLYEMSDPIVQEMHTKSGLWDARKRWSQRQKGVARVEIDIMDQIHQLVDSGTPVTVAGAGVGTFDIPIIKRYMPTLAERINYFPMDVSNVERFLQWSVTGGFRSTSKTADHRSVADIEYAHGLLLKLRDSVPLGTHWNKLFPGWF